MVTGAPTVVGRLLDVRDPRQAAVRLSVSTSVTGGCGRDPCSARGVTHSLMRCGGLHAGVRMSESESASAAPCSLPPALV